MRVRNRSDRHKASRNGRGSRGGPERSTTGWRRVVSAALLPALLLAGCGGNDDDRGSDVEVEAPATLSQDTLDWLELLHEPESYSTLSDQTLENLLENLGSVDAGTAGTPRFLVPQFTVGASGLFDTDPPDVLEQIRSLFDEAADRESGPAITGIESSCLLDLNDDGQCDQLQLDFRCSQCGSTSEVNPLVLEVGDDGEFAPIVDDYAQRFADDLADDAVLLVDEAPDALTRQAWQRLGATFAVADDVAKFVPTGFTCVKIPKVKVRFCITTP